MTDYKVVTTAQIAGTVGRAYINPKAIVVIGAAEGVGRPYEFRRVLFPGGEVPVLNTLDNLTVLFEGNPPFEVIP